MTATLCILLCALGHLHRDGYPAWRVILRPLVGGPFGWLQSLSTQLARLCGGALCTMGCLCLYPDRHGAILGALITLGFWADQKHGEGQGGSSASDASFLMISGMSSLFPLANYAGIFVMYAGLAKVPIWFFWWGMQRRFAIDRYLRVLNTGGPEKESLFVPTRLAAATFGALVGAAVVAIGRMNG